MTALLFLALCRNWHTKNIIIDMAIGDTRSPLHMQPPPHYGLDVFLPREKGDTNSKPQDDDSDDDGDDNCDDMHSDDDLDDEDGGLDGVEMPSEFEHFPNDVTNTKHTTTPSSSKTSSNNSTSKDGKADLSSPFFQRAPLPPPQKKRGKYNLRNQGTPLPTPSPPPPKPSTSTPRGGYHGKKRTMDFDVNISDDENVKSPSPKRPFFTPKPKRPYQNRGYPQNRSTSSTTYFTSRLDTVSKDPPPVLRFDNPRGRYKFFLSYISC